MSELSTIIQSLENPFADLSSSQSEHAQKLITALIHEGQNHQLPTWSAHMTPIIEPPALLGQLLAGIHNGNLLSSELYPHLSTIEKQLIDWFCQLFIQNHGHFTHGSSYANLEALWQARDHLTHNSNSNIVYGSDACHYSIAKACQILGLQFQAIPSDENGKIQIDALKKACQQQIPIAIVATAGTSSCGAIDDLQACIKIAQHYQCWCHIDAAWGGALQLSEQIEYQLNTRGADSICFDPHKALGQPRPCSILLYREPLSSISGLDYLTTQPKKTLAGSYGGELFLPLWCSLLLDKEGLIRQLNHRLQQASLFASMLQKNTAWPIWHSPTGIVCFKTDSDLTALEDKAIFSTSRIDGQQVYRAVFADHTTSAQALFTELESYL